MTQNIKIAELEDVVRRVVKEEFKRVNIHFSTDPVEVLEYVAVNQKWPREGDDYWIVDSCGRAHAFVFKRDKDSSVDMQNEHSKIGMYRTKEYAEWMALHLQAHSKLRGIAERDYDSDKISWGGESQRKLQLRFRHEGDNYDAGRWQFNAEFGIQEQGAIYFAIDQTVDDRKRDYTCLDKIKDEMGELMPYLLWKPEKKA